MAVRTDTRLLAAAVLLYGVIAIPTGVRRGTDFAIHVPVAQAWLRGSPLYDTPPHVGMWWPPFAIVLVAPFAALAAVAGLAWTKAVWGSVSLVCLGWALDRLPKDSWRTTALAVLAVVVPLHRNFEDLNLNAFLLALWVAAARDLMQARERRAAIWIGTAAAIKVFPGVLLAYFALRRRWAALAVGLVTAGVLTVLPLLRSGVSGAEQGVVAWTANGSAVQGALRGSNQSLAALAVRVHLPLPGLIVLDLSCIGVALVAMQRWSDEANAGHALGILALVSVLLSPIAWVHYFLLALPAWLTALERGGTAQWARAARLVAAVGTSGVLTIFSLTLRNIIFDLSLYTWGALVLLLVLAFVRPNSARYRVAALSG